MVRVNFVVMVASWQSRIGQRTRPITWPTVLGLDVLMGFAGQVSLGTGLDVEATMLYSPISCQFLLRVRLTVPATGGILI